jgi:hypothetical protein
MPVAPILRAHYTNNAQLAVFIPKCGGGVSLLLQVAAIVELHRPISQLREFLTCVGCPCAVSGTPVLPYSRIRFLCSIPSSLHIRDWHGVGRTPGGLLVAFFVDAESGVQLKRRIYVPVLDVN